MPAGNGVWYFLDPPPFQFTSTCTPGRLPQPQQRGQSRYLRRGAAGRQARRPPSCWRLRTCATVAQSPPRGAARAARAAPRKVTPAQLPPAGRNPRAPVRGRRPAAKLPGALPSSSPPVLPCGSHARSLSVRVPLSPPTF